MSVFSKIWRGMREALNPCLEAAPVVSAPQWNYSLVTVTQAVPQDAPAEPDVVPPPEDETADIAKASTQKERYLVLTNVLPEEIYDTFEEAKAVALEDDVKLGDMIDRVVASVQPSISAE